MIKICYIIGTMEIGGAEKQLLNLLKNIDRKKFEPFLIAFKGGALKAEFQKTARVIIAGKRFKIDPLFLIKLALLLKKEQPDILHTFMFTANTWGRSAGIAAGVPVIISSERCVDLWKKWYHRLIDRALLIFTDKVLGNSEAVKNFYMKSEKIPPKKLGAVYNGIDLSSFEKTRDLAEVKTEIGLKNADFIIGAGGRFTIQKGFMSLLKAVPYVLEKCPDAYFVFVGDGPLMGVYRKFVEEKGITERVFFTGYRKDIIDVFALCDIIVLPSLFEGMPNIVLEAMALKKPVIGTQIPEIEELIKDGINGFLVPVHKNAGDIAEKIVILKRAPELRRKMGENGYIAIKEKYSMISMVKGYEKVYRQFYRDKQKKCVRYAE